MNFLAGLLALVVYCFLYVSLTSCQPEKSAVSEERFNQGLQAVRERVYQGLLLMSIPAASSGKVFFKTSTELSEDCIRTARVVSQSFEQPSTMAKARSIMIGSVIEVYKHQKNNTFQGVMNMLCKTLYEQAKSWPSEFPDLDKMRQAVQIPKPKKNYILEVPTSVGNVTEWINSTPMPYDEPELVKFQIIRQVLRFGNMTLKAAGAQLERMGIAKAIDQAVFKNPTYKSTVDKLFKNDLDEFVGHLYTQGVEKMNDTEVALQGPEFLKKLDQLFLNNELVKEKYGELKKKAMAGEI